MLEFYVESGFSLRQLRECATGPDMDSFADWLQSAGFRRRPAQLILRGAAHQGEWASIGQVRAGQFDERVLDTFTGHLAACSCAHSFRGRNLRHLKGAKRFVEYLRDRGLAPLAKTAADPLPALVEAFSDWMRRHRGTTESTIALYAPIAQEFLGACRVDTAQYDATLVRKFIIDRASRTGHSRPAAF